MNFNLVLYFTHFQITPQKMLFDLKKNISGEKSTGFTKSTEWSTVPTQTHTKHKQKRPWNAGVFFTPRSITQAGWHPAQQLSHWKRDLQVTPQALWVWASYWGGKLPQTPWSNFSFRSQAWGRGSPRSAGSYLWSTPSKPFGPGSPAPGPWPARNWATQ